MAFAAALAGLTSMGVRPFFGLSVLGTAPISLAYAWLGHEAKEPGGLQWPLLIAFVLPGVGLLAAWLFGHFWRAAAPKAG